MDMIKYYYAVKEDGLSGTPFELHTTRGIVALERIAADVGEDLYYHNGGSDMFWPISIDLYNSEMRHLGEFRVGVGTTTQFAATKVEG